MRRETEKKENSFFNNRKSEMKTVKMVFINRGYAEEKINNSTL